MMSLEQPSGPADRYAIAPGPFGGLCLTGNETQVLTVGFGAGPTEGLVRDDDAFAEASGQLVEYLDGRRRQFDFRMAAPGQGFRHRVWEALLTIGYGETASYGAIARALGAPNAARAVGSANHDNPLAIVVPCHRVVGSKGSLIGYAGGLTTKRYLLDLEAGALF